MATKIVLGIAVIVVIALAILLVLPGTETGQYVGSKRCTDSDGGANYYVKGTATSGSISQTDTCLADGRLLEYDCEGGDVFGTYYRCPSGCSNGACVGVTTTTRVSSTTTTTSATTTTTLNQSTTTTTAIRTCVDTDGGLNFNVKGNTTTSGSPTQVDNCVAASRLQEFYCEPGTGMTFADYYDCPNGCSNGACIG
jgi:hypothetical protein